MELFDETKAPLVSVWDDEKQRQDSKVVILQAIANISDISVKEADAILDEMDRLLVSEADDGENQTNRAL